MNKAKEFAALIGARVVIPSKPLLYRKKGEAENYFTETNIAGSFDKLKAPVQQKPRRVK